MNIERRTPQNTAVILVDPMTVYANSFRSQSIEENLNGTVALAKTALGFGISLVVTATSANSPRGALYPALAETLGDHPVIRRARWFDAFDDPDFEAAVEATGVKHLVIAGLLTEGCVLYTALGALRRDYTVSLVVDASAGETEVTHQAAVTRLTQLGVTPITWFSFATEIQRTYRNIETVEVYYDVMSHAPAFANTAAQPIEYDLANQPGAIVETRMVHDVHRRATSLLAEAAARPGAPAAALREVRDFLVATLRHHHTTEDERLWPLITALAPDTGDPLGGLTEEHERLEVALTALEKAEITDGARHSALAGAAADVRDLVHLHLRHEEPVLFPALRAHVSEEDWKEFADYVRSTNPPTGAQLMAGFIDLVATPQEADLFFADLPAPVKEEVLPAMRQQARITLDPLLTRG